jgi:hypothetical protein
LQKSAIGATSFRRGTFLLPPLGRRPAIIAIAHICSTKLRGLGRMNQIFAVVRAKGSAWDHRQLMEQQVGWRSHASFMNGLEAEGFVLLGGPLDGTSDAYSLCERRPRSRFAFVCPKTPGGPRCWRRRESRNGAFVSAT